MINLYFQLNSNITVYSSVQQQFKIIILNERTSKTQRQIADEIGVSLKPLSVTSTDNMKKKEKIDVNRAGKKNYS